MKNASDLDLVLEAIKYIEHLQQKVVCMASKTRAEDQDENDDTLMETVAETQGAEG